MFAPAQRIQGKNKTKKRWLATLKGVQANTSVKILIKSMIPKWITKRFFLSKNYKRIECANEKGKVQIILFTQGHV